MTTPIVLVVEDNRTQQYITQKLCEKFEFDAHVVSTAEEALDAVAHTHYATVLLDINLPGMDGFECARRIRSMDEKLNQHTPVIAVTIRSSDEDKQRCLEVGMDDYITKPFPAETLRIMLLRYAYEPSHPNLKLLRRLPRGRAAS